MDVTYSWLPPVRVVDEGASVVGGSIVDDDDVDVTVCLAERRV
jgi:hypothetical protein